ncbi:MAG: nucleotidyltransferase domain-containing protein [Candidatus Bathyarchaeota archaeon]|nr:nucleotidyltransferase domain-containing protein [Candidatus Bathyarchaeota archaeon]
MTEGIETYYTASHWNLLNSLRDEALEMMRPLHQRHIQALAYGSIARGDVKPTSDIDIIIPNPPAPSIIETLIEAETSISLRMIIQATPKYAAKAYIHTAQDRSYSLPLVPLRSHERDFYSFAGSVDNSHLGNDNRVPGVTKALKLITPTPQGHLERAVSGREGFTAKALGISVTAVHNRIRTLQRRKKIGRTGVYIQRILHPEEGFGDVYQKLARIRPSLRRRQRL